MHPEHIRYLVENLQAKQVAHSGRSLWDHLAGTWLILHDQGERADLCNAGLFHSVYGTRQFRHQCVPFEARPEIRRLIGSEAETLVYLFCVIDRPKVLFKHQTSVFNFHTHRPFDIAEYFDDLMKIEKANLQEQGVLS